MKALVPSMKTGKNVDGIIEIKLPSMKTGKNMDGRIINNEICQDYT